MKKILGIGNALTDIILRIEDDKILSFLNLPKAGMTLVDTAQSIQILETFKHLVPQKITGGSASNTINGVTRLGMKAGFIGKVGRDEIGTFFTNDCTNNGVVPLLALSDTPSGKCIVLVSPDSERTMCTYLGAASELEYTDLSKDIFQGFSVFHIEGYLVQNHELILNAVRMAKELGLKVSLDLASFNVVEANYDFLHELVEKYIDIVFANEEEAKSFTGKHPEEALNDMAQLCDFAIVKIGKHGSLIKQGVNMYRIKSSRSNAIDTTGAGDLYAAGFLYGFALGAPLDVCGEIASVVAGKVVEVIGAKMSDETWIDINKQIKRLI